MTSSEHPSYKDRDRVPVLEQQISDLKMLTSHQSLTIKRLQEEGIAKADRITALLGADTRGVHGSLAMTRGLRSIGPSQLLTSPLPRPALDPSNIRDSKMQQLINEVQYWKRHFNLAEEKLEELKKEKATLESSPLKPLSENIRDPESLYLKKVLEENSDLKMKLNKVKSQNIIFDDEIDFNDRGKENNASLPSNVPDKVRKNVSIKSKSQNVLKPKPSQVRSKSMPNAGTDSRKSASVKSNSTESRKDGKAVEISSKSRGKDHSPSSRVSFRPDNDEWSHRPPGPQPPPPHHHRHHHQPPPPHHHHVHHQQPSNHILQQIYDLTNRNRCLQSQVFSLRAELARRDEAASAHNQETNAPGGPSRDPEAERSLRVRLEEAEAEVSKLEAKCDNLLEQKKSHLEKITSLQKHLDTLLIPKDDFDL